MNEPWEQLAKYFAGELSAEESQKMESWIKADPNREVKINRLHEIWKESENPPYKINVDQAWNKLSGEMDKFERKTKEIDSFPLATGTIHKLPSSYSGQKTRRPSGTIRRTILVAATILIVVTAGLFSFYLHFENEKAKTAESDKRVFVTKNGERAIYVLGDGSRVILHADSRLEIPDDYNQENRELFLEGEAYFETAHNPKKPFTVHSQHTYARVLGTSFLVQAWPKSNQGVEVVVSEGTVAFGDSRKQKADGNQEVLITQNQMAMLSLDKEPVITDVVDMDWYLGWTEGRLAFENRPLSEVLSRLERWYDVEIEVENENIGMRKITAEIDYSQSMREVFKGIALTLELEFEEEGRTVIFKSGKKEKDE